MKFIFLLSFLWAVILIWGNSVSLGIGDNISLEKEKFFPSVIDYSSGIDNVNSGEFKNYSPKINSLFFKWQIYKKLFLKLNIFYNHYKREAMLAYQDSSGHHIIYIWDLNIDLMYEIFNFNKFINLYLFLGLNRDLIFYIYDTGDILDGDPFSGCYRRDIYQVNEYPQIYGMNAGINFELRVLKFLSLELIFLRTWKYFDFSNCDVANESQLFTIHKGWKNFYYLQIGLSIRFK